MTMAFAVARGLRAHTGGNGPNSPWELEFRTPYGNSQGELPVEPGRYRLLWTPVAPSSHRAVLTWSLLGLEDAISVGTASPVGASHGWTFATSPGGRDEVLGIERVAEAYPEHYRAGPGRPRGPLPAMVDTTIRRVVSNDSFELPHQFAVAWRPYHRRGAPDLYPAEHRDAIDAINSGIFHHLHAGVYQAGFTDDPRVYAEAYTALFRELDGLERRLAGREFLVGDHLTDADVWLFTFLVRFDLVYYTHFRTNRTALREYPNLWRFARRTYQRPEVRAVTDFEAIKEGYFRGVDRFVTPIVPLGPDPAPWAEPIPSAAG